MASELASRECGPVAILDAIVRPLANEIMLSNVDRSLVRGEARCSADSGSNWIVDGVLTVGARSRELERANDLSPRVRTEFVRKDQGTDRHDPTRWAPTRQNGGVPGGTGGRERVTDNCVYGNEAPTTVVGFLTRPGLAEFRHQSTPMTGTRQVNVSPEPASDPRPLGQVTHPPLTVPTHLGSLLTILQNDGDQKRFRMFIRFVATVAAFAVLGSGLVVSAGIPPAYASSACDIAEATLISQIRTASTLSSIRTAADSYRTCLSRIAVSKNSSASAYPASGAHFLSLVTDESTYSAGLGNGRNYALRAAADYRMALLGEESAINPFAGGDGCQSAYQVVLAHGLTIGDIGLADMAREAFQSCLSLRSNPHAQVSIVHSGGPVVGTILRLGSTSWPAFAARSVQWYRNGAAILGQTSTSYTVQPQDVGAQISVRVTVSASGLTPVTRVAIAPVVPLSGVTSAPRAVSATPGERSVVLQWQPPSTLNGGVITDYVIRYQADDSGSVVTVDDGVGTRTAYTVSDLSPGIVHSFSVSAVTAFGESASTTVTATPSLDRMAPPQSLSVVPRFSGLDVDWVAPPLAEGERILTYLIRYRPVGEAVWETSEDLGGVDTSASIAGLIAGVEYEVSVGAISNLRASDPAVGRAVPLSATGTAPAGITASPRVNSVALSWTAPSVPEGQDLVDYQVQYRSVSDGVWRAHADGVSTSTVTSIGGLVPGQLYEFSVSAVFTSGVGAAAMVSSVPLAPGDSIEGWGALRNFGPEVVSAQSLATSVSCPSIGTCIAVGALAATRGPGSADGFVLDQKDARWGTPSRLVTSTVDGSWASLNSVSCPAVDVCATGGTDGFRAVVATMREGIWSRPTVVVPIEGSQSSVVAVDCPSVGNCVAAGWFLGLDGYRIFAVSQVNGTWGAYRFLTPPIIAASGTPSAGVSSLSCSSAGDCVIGGFTVDADGPQAVIISSTSGVWTPPAAVVPKSLNSGHDAEVTSVSCSGAGECGAGGYFTDASGRQAFVVMRVDGEWSDAEMLISPDPNQNGFASVTAISCPAAGACVALGRFASNSFAASQVGEGWNLHLIQDTQDLVAIQATALSCDVDGDCYVFGSATSTRAWTSTAFVVSRVDGSWREPDLIVPEAPTDRVTIRDIGCVVSNDYCAAAGFTWDGDGQWRQATVVNISKGVVPTPPIRFEASTRPGAVDLSWDAPAELFGETLLEYVVRYRESGSVTWSTMTGLPPSQRTATVGELEDGAAYELQVQAVSGVGPGVVASLVATVPPLTLSTTRVAGGDRYATSAAISQQAFPTSEIGAGVPVVFVSSGANFPDALSAGPVVSQLGGPVLLTTPTALPDSVRTEIVRLRPQQIVVVGGTGAVSNAVFTQLQSLAPQVVRLGGASRYETSRNVTGFGFGESGASVAYVAGGENFADALAAGAAAGSKNAPIVLVPGRASSVDVATLELLRELGVTRIFVVGGEGAVSAGVASSLRTVAPVTRLSGADRLATAQAVNREAFNDADTVYLAYAFNFPDALGGGVLATVKPGPLFTVPGTCVPSAVIAEIQRIGASKVVLLGGSGVLNSNVATLRPCA